MIQPKSMREYRVIIQQVAHLGIAHWNVGEKPSGFMFHLPDGAGTKLTVPVPYVIFELARESQIRKALIEFKVSLKPALLHLVPGYFMEALRALIAEHDWRMNLRYETKGEKHIPETCPTCKVIKKMETIE